MTYVYEHFRNNQNLPHPFEINAALHEAQIERLDQGYTTYGTRAQNDTRKDFLGT
jgi:hypothetical protein